MSISGEMPENWVEEDKEPSQITFTPTLASPIAPGIDWITDFELQAHLAALLPTSLIFVSERPFITEILNGSIDIRNLNEVQKDRAMAIYCATKPRETIDPKLNMESLADSFPPRESKPPAIVLSLEMALERCSGKRDRRWACGIRPARFFGDEFLRYDCRNSTSMDVFLTILYRKKYWCRPSEELRLMPDLTIQKSLFLISINLWRFIAFD